MNQVIVTAVVKGGVGKTSAAAALAQAAAADNKKVLCIDLDPQANLTLMLAAEPNTAGSYQLLHGADPLQILQHSPQGIDVIAGNADLATESTTPASGKRLHDAIQPLRKIYDLIIIDTPPQMGEPLFNGLQAATKLIIPLETDTNALQGLYQIVSLARRVQEKNKELEIMGVILPRYDARPKINRYLQEVIAEKGQEVGAPFLMAIRPGIAIREAQAMQESLYDYAPNSKPAQDYEELYKKIMEE